MCGFLRSPRMHLAHSVKNEQAHAGFAHLISTGYWSVRKDHMVELSIAVSSTGWPSTRLCASARTFPVLFKIGHTRPRLPRRAHDCPLETLWGLPSIVNPSWGFIAPNIKSQSNSNYNNYVRWHSRAARAPGSSGCSGSGWSALTRCSY